MNIFTSEDRESLAESALDLAYSASGSGTCGARAG